MPPESNKMPGQMDEAEMARQLEAERRQLSSGPVRLPPEPSRQEQAGDQSSDEDEPIGLPYPPSGKQEQSDWARKYQQTMQKAQKEYWEKMAKEAVKKAAKGIWQWILGLLHSAIGPIIAAFGAASIPAWLIIGAIVAAILLFAGLAIYANNDPCHFIKDTGGWGLIIIDALKKNVDWAQCLK